MKFVLAALVLATACVAETPSAPGPAVGPTPSSGPESPGCTTIDYTAQCFVERVRFLEGLILFGVLLGATLAALTCMSALNTPTKFQQPKERTE